MNFDFGKGMNFGAFKFDSLVNSLKNLKNIKPTIGKSWPAISNTNLFKLKTAPLYVAAAARRNILGEADLEVETKRKNFNALKDSITPILNTYEINRVNSINLFDSYQNYLTENKKLGKQVLDTNSEIQTNDRKTYYQNEATDSLDLYYLILLSVYIVTVVGFAICWYLLPTTLSTPKIVFLFICLILYPLFSLRILQYIMYLYTLLLEYLPNNVYNKST
jgi:hypothetical protein